MKIGVIGAGKVGTSLGKYLGSSGLSLTGFFDFHENVAKEAAEFTNSRFYQNVELLVEESDVLFLTVPDGVISTVWEQIKDLPVAGKYVCHCSGAMSAVDAFPDAKEKGAYAYSVHPLFAVSDRFHSHGELKGAYFTIEGDESKDTIPKLFENLGNPVCKITAKDKATYHLAAAIASNHVVALMNQSIELLMKCGFSEEGARGALSPIVKGNVAHILEDGTTASLTGPVERADLSTIIKHLDCLDEEDQLLYCLLSRKLLSIGKKKNPERDYSTMDTFLAGKVR